MKNIANLRVLISKLFRYQKQNRKLIEKTLRLNSLLIDLEISNYFELFMFLYHNNTAKVFARLTKFFGGLLYTSGPPKNFLYVVIIYRI